jgi:spore coat polysaccharide biosynthesis protein SpsF
MEKTNEASAPEDGYARGGELTLGTAQLGILNYGRANKTGRPSREIAVQLVREALDRGISCIDTARAYDRAEQIVGEALKGRGERVCVVTKLSPFENLPDTAPEVQMRSAVEDSVFRSCRELGLEQIPVLLLHRWSHRSSHHGAVWQRLLELKSEGVIAALGASVSTPPEAEEALAEREIRHLQLPFNLLDRRWRSGRVPELATKRKIFIHARSVLLQGILVSDPSAWPDVAGISANDLVSQIEQLARRLGRANRLDLCIAFARAQPWIQSLVMGVETIAQLHDLIDSFQRPALTQSEVADVVRTMPELPETLLNPALWR